MSIPTSANYVFLPWTRQGAAAGIQTPDSLGQDQAGVASTTVKLRINNTVDIDRQVRLYGPGDITGIDTQQVIRTEPRHLATDFEPNYFPAVEFDRPDFPWLFTPAKAGATGKLRPWLCLVVVKKQEGVTLRAGGALPLPALEIKSPALPARELPDLSESWAWAHAQVAGSAPQEDPLKAALAGNPALTVSRLLCPRRLDPETEYLACVVPTFELGRKAGLGATIESADLDKLAPAWSSGEQAPPAVTLPVYFHWEFRTAAGDGADFEALVRLLEPREMPAEAGKRRLDISRPGFQIDPPLESDLTLELEGALRVPDAEGADGAEPAEWPQENRTRFQNKLKEILNAPWQAMNDPEHDPLFAPPIYGRWQAAQHTVDLDPKPGDPQPSPPWLHELNLDPRHRAVAALGTRVVQTQQEELMASAWEQMGEIEKINQMKRQAQLARAVNQVYHAKHFDRFSEEALLKVVAPAQSRITIAVAPTGLNYTGAQARTMLSNAISKSAIPNRVVSAPLRRWASPRGAVSARFQQVEEPPIAVVAKLNNVTSIVSPQKPEAGLVMLDLVAEAPDAGAAAGLKDTADFHRIPNALDTAPNLTNFTVINEGTARTLLNFSLGDFKSPDEQEFLAAAKAHQLYLDTRAFPSSLAPSEPQPMSLQGAKTELVNSLDPEKTITARIKASIKIEGAAAQAGDPLDPIMDAPEFPQPMYEALRDLSQDFLFPGLEHTPPNTITLLETNTKFIEAFMVGLNTEMGAELLWRNYPTDQRGTYFRRFWDKDQPDLEEPIKDWDAGNLGDNASAGENLVLLIRGELLRRYPNSVIYAVKAVEENGQIDLSTDPQHEKHPLFRGTLKPDVTFLGFDLTPENAVAEPGWFFVIQQQPTEPRFGMDKADWDEQDPPALTTWDNLNWRHMADTEEELNALSHASINVSMPDIDKAKWGKNSAHQAYITSQRPVRIAIHASEMIHQG
ncbi:MAG TPA: hypothetical protein VFY40_25395 [Blastocatellia bacterium]|nr:hypothetical protein [Blastocatellia bacterium]